MPREPTIAETKERDFFSVAREGAFAPPERSTAVSAPDVGDGTRQVSVRSQDGADRRLLPRLPRYHDRRRITASLHTAVELELDRGAAFLVVPVFLATGALVYFNLDAEPGVLPLLSGAAALLAAWMLSASRPWLHMVLSAALLIVAGVGLAKLEGWRSGTRMLGGEISTRLTGQVVAIDHLARGRVRLTLDVIATERPTLRYAPARVRASARRIPEQLRIGSHVSGIVRLLPISGPLRPGSYDFSFEAYFDRLGATAFFLKGPDVVASALPEIPGGHLAALIENARLAVADRIRDRIGGAEGEIAAALVVGVRAGIPEAVNEALRRSGLYHVISISGLHMALVAGTIMGALRLAFAFFPGFASRLPVKKFAAAAALAATAGYLFFSGAEVAAQRSFLMLAVMLAAVLVDRAAITMRNLAIAAIAVIVVSPHEVVGPSFQMSFAAAGALIGTYAAWSSYSARRNAGRTPPTHSFLRTGLRMIGLGLAGLAMTSLIAGFATAIFGAYHFQRVSPLGLGANLVAMPVVSIFVMPFAVAAAIFMPFGLDGPFLDVMGWGLSVMIAVAEWFSVQSPLDAVGAVPSASVIALASALLIATLATTWLRVLAIPIAASGLALLATGTRPDVLVSEDGRLVAVTLSGERIAVNRARASAFTVEDWQRALGAASTVGPKEGDIIPGGTPDSAFICRQGLCFARHASGAVVAYAADRASAEEVCAMATLVVVDDATGRRPCAKADAQVITKRDLARYGAASVSFVSTGNASRQPRAVITYAVREPYRPWHEHRHFSRAARGLAPFLAKQPSVKLQPAANGATAPANGKTSTNEGTGEHE